MHSRFEHNGLSWVDLESPNRAEVHDLIAEFDIAPLVAEELLLPSTKPRVEFHPTYAYIVLHFPALRHSHKTREQEIDFIVSHKYLITTRYDTIDPLHNFSKIFEVNTMLDKSNVGEHAGYIFFYMLKKLYKSVEHEVEYVRHDLAAIEENVFSGHEVDMVAAISRCARDLLNLRQTIEPHREVLRELEANAARFFGEKYAPYARTLSNEYYRVHNHIMRNTEILHELRETNNSLLSTKQNEAMKILTIMAFVTFPLSLIASIFGMNTVWIPIVGLPGDFWIVMSIMGAATFLMFVFFKRKGWL
ncbi:magnesium transporter CorA family protein [Candidatus Kaiserbacteria bacterium]|nr:magnesium transporter CorA family protein [Candidatus Kaiserbacteria bacterium]